MDEDNQQPKNLKKTNNWPIYFVGVVVLLFIGAGVYVAPMFLQIAQDNQKHGLNNVPNQATGTERERKIRMTAEDRSLPRYKLLFAAKTPNSKYIKTSYVYDLFGDKLKKVPKKDHSSVQNFSVDKNSAFFTLVYKPDLNKYKTISAATHFFVKNNFSGDFSAKEAREIKISPETRKYFYKNFSYNAKSQKVLFNALDKIYKGSRPHKASEWGIYILDTSKTPGLKKIQKIANGLYPQWLDNEKFIYLGKRGLYVYDLKKGREKFAFGFRSKSEAESYLYVALSNDKKHIAWSFPKKSTIQVIKIVDSKKPVLQQEYLIKRATAVRPVWSLDDRVLVYLSPVDFKKFEHNNNSTPVFIKFLDIKKQKLAFRDLSKDDLRKFYNMVSFRVYEMLK